MPIHTHTFTSPCGNIILASYNDQLCLCDWHDHPCAQTNLHRLTRHIHEPFSLEPSPVILHARTQLNEYFTHTRTTFTIPLLPVGTNFQKLVWNALLNIPYGETRSYKDIALTVHNPKGIRAVAQAIAANGLCIFIPCHRVIGSNGSLTGFAAGLTIKHHLLSLESHP